MLDAALENGGRDNVTIVLLDVARPGTADSSSTGDDSGD